MRGIIAFALFQVFGIVFFGAELTQSGQIVGELNRNLDELVRRVRPRL